MNKLMPPTPKVCPQTFKARECLPTSQNCLWQIDSGMVRTLTYLEDGTMIILGLWGPGYVVGTSLSADSCQVECLADVQAYQLHSIDTRIVEQAQQSSLRQIQNLIVVRHGKIRTRLRRFLTWFAQEFGQLTKEGYSIPFRLTHQDIADTIGSTRVTVTRLMKELERENSLCCSKESYLIRFPVIQSSLETACRVGRSA